MNYNTLTPRKSLNKAFLKVKPNRTQIDSFKSQLSSLLGQIKEGESEEFHKNIIADFLKNTYYAPDYYINTKGRNDQVIHNGKNTKSSVGVIIEAKSPTNKTEMPLPTKINTKAMQELVLYFLRERITQSNTEVRHLVITNIHEWFIFDAHLFDTLFARNKQLVKKFKDFEAGMLSATNTDHFYREIAQPAIEAVENEISFTYFNLKDYEKPLKSGKEDDKKLIVLYKLLSPEHLLKLPFANDSNSLDKSFYNELLYIMGLEEFQEKGKKLIQRRPEKDRIYGTLLESVISKLESRGELHRLDNPQQYGKNTEDRLFNVGLQLVITWLNRILFLKLLEAQLLDYNQGDKSFAFLNLKRIGNFNKLADLFFNVLAVPLEKRKPAFQEAYAKVPYLNSSLFEANELENRALHIDTLDASESILVSKGTVLKDGKGKRLAGELPILEYLFSFLEAYDFSSEGSEEIQEENKSLINASVLGLIFEKINGYKDGSFFTPGFITMYMCRETIRRAVVEKFNSHYNWNCQEFSELKEDLIQEIKNSDVGRKGVRSQANAIINSLKICDPAVGSGHFLVSALNELIAIKHDLNVLCDRAGEPLTEYQISIENDELIITDLEDQLFTYKPTDTKSQRLQEALFHEKQELIEKCLFGVDINPNSVKICRLRLWIELLKSAYYRQTEKIENSSPVCYGDYEIKELETLPNIDINIKTGNSLISRFGLDEDLSNALKKSKWNISTYRNAVDSYRNAISKDEKREMESLINDIKSDFRTEINKNDPKIKRKAKLAGELYNLTMQQGLFEVSKAEQKKRKKQIDKLETDINKLETDIEEIKSNAIYENAFEWRFEFPEVLDDEGNFVGFDVVIGNPPYIRMQDLQKHKGVVAYYSDQYVSGKKGNYDIYVLFIELGLKIGTGKMTYILPHKFINSAYGEGVRTLISKKSNISQLVHFGPLQIFEDASTYTCLLFLDNQDKEYFLYNQVELLEDWKVKPTTGFSTVPNKAISQTDWKLLNAEEFQLLQKLNDGSMALDQITTRIFQGIKTSADKIYIVEEESRSGLTLEVRCPQDGNTYKVESQLFHRLIKGGDSKKYNFRKSNLLVLFPYQDGKLINENDLAEKYPMTYKYLKGHKEYLQNRENGKMKGSKWYGYVYPKALDVIGLPKIFTPDIAPAPSFMIDQQGDKYFTGGAAGGYGIVPESINSFYLLGVLNSSMVNWYIARTSTQMRGGWYSFESRFIKNIPIKSLENGNTNAIANLVENILFKKGDDPSEDTSELENQINQKVYELYGLTEEEIKIVEGVVD